MLHVLASTYVEMGKADIAVRLMRFLEAGLNLVGTVMMSMITKLTTMFAVAIKSFVNIIGTPSIHICNNMSTIGRINENRRFIFKVPKPVMALCRQKHSCNYHMTIR